MDENKALIGVILDKSGSMEPLTKDTIGGFNTFLAEQKAQPGECDFTLVQFSTDYKFTNFRQPIRDVAPLDTKTYRTGGGTALLDAMGKCIDEIGLYLDAMPEPNRPAKVIIAVITDGEENSSHEYTHEQIAEKVKRQQESYNWKFVFLGANMDAITVAKSYGIPAAAAAAFVATPRATKHLYGNFSTNVSSYRSGGATGMSWSNEQRDQMTDESDPDKP